MRFDFHTRLSLGSADPAIELSGIRCLGIFVDTISAEGTTSAFAIDNFTAITTKGGCRHECRSRAA